MLRLDIPPLNPLPTLFGAGVFYVAFSAFLILDDLGKFNISGLFSIPNTRHYVFPHGIIFVSMLVGLLVSVFGIGKMFVIQCCLRIEKKYEKMKKKKRQRKSVALERQIVAEPLASPLGSEFPSNKRRPLALRIDGSHLALATLLCEMRISISGSPGPTASLPFMDCQSRVILWCIACALFFANCYCFPRASLYIAIHIVAIAYLYFTTMTLLRPRCTEQEWSLRFFPREQEPRVEQFLADSPLTTLL
ncbi:hypothetical protein QR680_013843 [Steinernema hermaphroditum]|uniref:Uncharacterized protein n=1 Tax=Steinernema hermaphroditum TaxID=289476 RepID=A0AA39I895_9BILA|nr:hypothetical protein QR680_013843 [Steinernema hermaphroditum]